MSGAAPRQTSLRPFERHHRGENDDGSPENDAVAKRLCATRSRRKPCARNGQAVARMSVAPMSSFAILLLSGIQLNGRRPDGPASASKLLDDERSRGREERHRAVRFGIVSPPGEGEPCQSARPGLRGRAGWPIIGTLAARTARNAAGTSARYRGFGRRQSFRTRESASVASA